MILGQVGKGTPRPAWDDSNSTCPTRQVALRKHPSAGTTSLLQQLLAGMREQEQMAFSNRLPDDLGVETAAAKLRRRMHSLVR